MMGNKARKESTRVRKNIAAVVDHAPGKATWQVRDYRGGITPAVAGNDPSRAIGIGSFDRVVLYLSALRGLQMGLFREPEDIILASRHKLDGNRGTIGCMSNGLKLSFRNVLAQLMVSGDVSAREMCLEGLNSSGADINDLIADTLSDLGMPRTSLIYDFEASGCHRVSGYTTTEDQCHLYQMLLEAECHVSAASGWRLGRCAPAALELMSQNLDRSGIAENLPGYGPFQTTVVHHPSITKGDRVTVNDAGIVYEAGEAQYIVAIAIDGLPASWNDLPGISAGWQVLRQISMLCYSEVLVIHGDVTSFETGTFGM